MPGCAEIPPLMMPEDAPPLALGLVVEGPEASDDKRERCVNYGNRLGVRVVPRNAARVTAWLHLEDGKNRLEILSEARGRVLREAREAWGMGELCDDAFRRAAQQLVLEMRIRDAPRQASARPAPAPSS